MANIVNKDKESLVSAEKVRSLLSYNPETGVFLRNKPFGRYKAGLPAGHLMFNGYRVIRIGEFKFLAGRLAWLYVHGEWPPHEIDHINRNQDDNRISNLRAATREENSWNSNKFGRNSTGEEFIHKSRNGYRVRLIRNQETIFDKRFKSLDNAIIERNAMIVNFSSKMIGGQCG